MINVSIDGKDLKIKLEKENDRRVSLWMEYDNTIVYSTLVITNRSINDKKDDKNTNFTVFYKEMSYANSRNFIKKESNKTDKEILISRTIDRSLRPFLRNLISIDLTLSVMLLQGNSNVDMTLWSGFFLLHSCLENEAKTSSTSILGNPYGKKIVLKDKSSLTVALNKDGFVMMEGTLRKLEKLQVLEILTKIQEEQKNFALCYEKIPCFGLLSLNINRQMEEIESYKRTNRDWLEIRPLHIEINPLKTETNSFQEVNSKKQTSVLFQRGETKVLVVMGLYQLETTEIQLFYRFHPFSVNDSGETYGNSRREKGHGDFAKHCLDSYWKPQLSYKVISEVLNCNGSSSMATVCGTSLCCSLEYGEELISGITGGKIGDNYIVDLTADEDHLSSCDLKVVNNEQGLICGLFMDTKQIMTLSELDFILDKTISGNIEIIKYMKSKIQTHSTIVQIKQSKIGIFVGKGGIHIKEMQKVLKCNLKVFDCGYVTLSAEDKNHFMLAQDVILSFNTLENNQKITAIVRGIKENDVEMTEEDQDKKEKTLNINLGVFTFNIEESLGKELVIGDVISGIVIIENNRIKVEQIEKIKIHNT